MQELYAPFTRTDAPIMVMDCPSSELTKYAANAMLASRITFMNEVANVCELVGADVDHVRRAMGADRRIGSSFLFPGVGFGGSCFPKDVKAMRRFAADSGYEFKMLRAVDEVNAYQKTRLVAKMREHYGRLKGKTLAVWGLAFKPKTDDMREAPAIPLIEALLKAGARVQAYDPEAMRVARRLFGTRVDVRRQQLRCPAGGGRPGHRHRVERVPPAGSGPDEDPAQGPRHLRRAQSVRARPHEAAWVHLLLDRPALRSARLRLAPAAPPR